MQVIDTLNYGSFPGKIMFTCGYSFKDICKELKRQKCNEWLLAFKQTEYLFSPNCLGFSSEQTIEVNGYLYYYSFICLKDQFDFSDRHHAILSHEVIHSCTHHLSSMFNIVKENEAFAYTHTHILNQCYNVLRKKATVKR